MSEFDQKLMQQAREKRDQMIRDKSQCCINCEWASIRPSFVVKEPDTWALHYVQCTWPRLNEISDSVSKPRNPNSDPTMQHMAGTTCHVFKLKK